MPRFDETNWTRYVPVTVDNSAAAAGLSYHQVDIRLAGAAYSDWQAHGKPDGSDLRVADQDGTLLGHWLEHVDTAAGALSIKAKVPAVAAGATRTLKVWYGNPSAASVSSPTTTIGPTTAIVGPADIITQSDIAGYNDGSWMVRLQHQDGPSGGGAGLNGRILCAATVGSTSQPSGNGRVARKHSDDGGVTWSGFTLIGNTADPSRGYSCQFLQELASGKLLLCFAYDLNTNLQTAHQTWYVASSTDGGATWTNLGPSPTRPLAVPWTVGAVPGIAYGAFREVVAGGDVLKMCYYYHSGDPGSTVALLRLPAGSEPTDGSAWVLHGNIVVSTTRKWNESSFIQTTDSNHYTCILRSDSSGDTGDLWQCYSSDGGVTWTAPAYLGLSANQDGATAYHAGAPMLYRLPVSGNIALGFSIRQPSGGPWGAAVVVSTDDGANFLDRAVSIPHVYSPVGVPYDYGYPSIAQNADGTIVVTCYRQVGGSSSTANIARVIVTEDWIVNSPNVYLDCESFTADWSSHGANVTISADRSHSGTQCVKVDNSAGTAIASAVDLWSHISTAQPGRNFAYSYWCYCSQMAAGQGYGASAGDWNAALRTTLSVLATNRHLQWYNGTAYQDTGLAVTDGAWHRITVRAATTGTTVSGTASVDGGTPAAIGQRAAGAGACTLSLGAGSTGSTTATTVYYDDIYSHQYSSVPPAVTVGAPASASSRRRRLILAGAC